MIRTQAWTQAEFRIELGVSLAGLEYDQELQMVQKERGGGEKNKERHREGR